MPTAVWPETLPRWSQADGYSTSFRDSRLITPMEKGPPKVRNRGRGTKPLTFSFIGEEDEITGLEAFWEESLSYGVLPFWKRDVALDGIELTDENGEFLTDENDEPLENSAWQLLQMAQEAPAITSLGGRLYSVSVTVIVLPTG